MKKFFIVIIMFLILASSFQTRDFSLLDYFDGDYTAYTEISTNENSVDLGFCYMQRNLENKKYLVGESLKVYNFEIGSALSKLKAKVVKTEVVNDEVVIYAYTSLIKDNVKVENKLVNLQIASKNDYSVIGWPLILGSF